MTRSRILDGNIQLVEYAPRVLDGPPATDHATIMSGDAVDIVTRLKVDLELLESRTLDGHTQELVYRPMVR